MAPRGRRRDRDRPVDVGAVRPTRTSRSGDAMAAPIARIRPTTAGSKVARPSLGRPRPRRSRRAPGPAAILGEHAQVDPAHAVDEEERSARHAAWHDGLRPVRRLDGRIDLDLGPFACRQGRLDVTAVVGAPRVRAQGHHRRQAYPKPVPARPSRCSVRAFEGRRPSTPAAERGMAARSIRRRDWVCDVDTGRGDRTRPGPTHHPDPPTCRPSSGPRPARPAGHRPGGPDDLVHLVEPAGASAGVVVLSLLYVLVQTILSTAPALGARIGRLARPIPRLVLAALFVTVVANQTGDASFRPLVALYIPVVSMAAVYGGREALIRRRSPPSATSAPRSCPANTSTTPSSAGSSSPRSASCS